MAGSAAWRKTYFPANNLMSGIFCRIFIFLSDRPHLSNVSHAPQSGIADLRQKAGAATSCRTAPA
ncbi:hypothetical protein [Pseudochelatococcus contaminans]|uniref:Uncharacterized protein n=1 Tax=Pseudochelatococcus contaminans TaxID=1538103 RepID=A0A7W6EIF2_9HYPH|nr:hypothetical protein [Pseudochelatococcus contaminans]MBB3811025.1 hypothetical protein [Pseudochelatococcus contaminans]